MTNNTSEQVNRIRNSYVPHEKSKLEELKALDKQVKLPAKIFSYVFGSIGAIVMGIGMSLIMTDIESKLGMGDMTAAAVIIGVAGLIMTLINYPIYKSFMSSRKKKYASKIIALSDSVINEQKTV